MFARTFAAIDVEARREVAARDVVADGGGRDRNLGRDDPTYRDAVPLVVVRHEGGVLASGACALNLFEGA